MMACSWKLHDGFDIDEFFLLLILFCLSGHMAFSLGGLEHILLSLLLFGNDEYYLFYCVSHSSVSSSSSRYSGTSDCPVRGSGTHATRTQPPSKHIRRTTHSRHTSQKECPSITQSLPLSYALVAA